MNFCCAVEFFHQMKSSYEAWELIAFLEAQENKTAQ